MSSSALLLLKRPALLTLAAMTLALVSARTSTVPSKQASSATQHKHINALYSQKIVGGKTISINTRPFMAEVSMLTGKDQRHQTLTHQCDATILGKLHVLSACHCFKNKNVKIYRIRVGSNYWKSGGQLVKVAKIMTHPKNNPKTFDYDVAVLKLASPLKLDGVTVKPVALVKPGTAIKGGLSVALTGWGYEDALHSRPLPSQLKEVEVETIDRAECQDDYSSFDLQVTDRMFCAMASGKDSCQGDSGGPIVHGKTGEQIGVISWSMGCAQMGSPGVFVDLAHKEVRKFINDALKV